MAAGTIRSHMKSYFIFRTSAAYPNEAKTLRFNSKQQARQELQSLIARDILFFERNCIIQPSKNHDSFNVRERITRKSIQTTLVELNIYDPIALTPA